MKTNVILVLIIICLLVGGGFLILRALNSHKVTQIVPASQPDAIVVLSSTGFTPKTVTIHPGARVQWVNNSGMAATVNSNPHPSNSDYRPLNLGEFQNGQTVQLVFPQKGTYGYHNYYNPSETGTIVVQ